jgi:hypothetical protein
MKKAKNLYHNDEFQLYGLKWEFMRRNPQYVADYNKFFRRDGELKPSANKKEVVKYFAKTYQLFNPLRPDLSFLDMFKELYLPEKVARRRKHWDNVRRMEKADQMNTKAYKIENALFEDSVKDIIEFEDIYKQINFWASGVYRLDTVGNNLDKVLSADEIEDIVRQRSGNENKEKSKFFIKVLIDGSAPLKNIVEAVKYELWREEMFKIRPFPERSRNRVPKLKSYLNVYLFREETKWTFDRIAKKIYPKEYDQALALAKPKVDIESLIKRVNEHYLQAKWYIDGGFREIR